MFPIVLDLEIVPVALVGSGELAFKRLKSLFDIGSAPNRDPVAVRSWIYAKLLAVLLMERLGEASRLFSPWGFPIGGGKPLEGVPRGVRTGSQRPCGQAAYDLCRLTGR